MNTHLIQNYSLYNAIYIPSMVQSSCKSCITKFPDIDLFGNHSTVNWFNSTPL